MATFKRRLAMLLAAAMLFTSVPYMEVTAADDSTPAVEQSTEGTTEGNTEGTTTPAPEAGSNQGEGNENEGDTPDAPVQGNEGTGSEGVSQTTDPELTAPAEGGNTQDPENTQNTENTDPETPVTEVPEVTSTDEPTEAVVKAESIRIVQKGKDTAPAKVNVGSTVALEVIAEPEGAEVGAVVWSSSDTTVATVTEEGVVKGITGATNDVTITARSADDDSLVAEVSIESYAGKWKKVNKKWKFVLPNGKYAKNKFVTIDGKKYYLGSDEYMKTGLFTASKKTYYALTKVEKEGDLVGELTSGWRKSGSKWYFFEEEKGFAAATGWRDIAGEDEVVKTYYFDTSTGAMKTGWFKVSKKTYYASSSGDIQKEWKTIKVTEKVNGKNKSVARNYYFDPETGVMATGWKTIDGRYYYFAGNGKNQTTTGWKQLSKVWYYMVKDENSHIYAATGWQQVKGKWYYLDPSEKLHGRMKTGWFTETVGEAVTTEADSEAVEGEITEEVEEQTASEPAAAGAVTKTYYLNSSGASVTGIQTISKKKYVFAKQADGKGVLAEDGWTNVGTDWYYVDPETHVPATGQTDIDGQTYYFDAKTGISKTGWIDLSTTKTTGSGKNKKTTKTYKFYYYLDDGTGKGVLQKNAWIDEGDNHYYAGADGKLVAGSFKINSEGIIVDDDNEPGEYYYFDAKSGKAKSGIIAVGSNTYLYKVQDDTGRPYRFTTPGKTEYNGMPYFIDEKDFSLANDRFVKDGDDYYYYNDKYKIVTEWLNVAKTIENTKTSSKKWYYFDPQTGKMVTGWVDYKNKKCYLDPDPDNLGIMVTGAKTIDGNQYYFNSSGYMQKGVVARNGSYYAYDLVTGILVTGKESWIDEDGNTWKLNTSTGEIKNYNKKIGAMDTKAQKATSSNSYLLMANKYYHFMGVYKKINDRWVRQQTWAFHCGAPSTGTPEGRQTIGSVRAAKKNLNIRFAHSKGYYAMYVSGGFYFHTRIYSLSQPNISKEVDSVSWKPVDNNLVDGLNPSGGRSISHGCIRLNFQNAHWIWKNIEKGTRVWVYNEKL